MSQIWARRYSGTRDLNDYAADLAMSPDGTEVFVAGTSVRSSRRGYDYTVVAYGTATGKQSWVARFDGGHGTDEARSLAVTPDGTKVIVTGESYGGSRSRFDYATVAFDSATGAQLWASRYTSRGNEDDHPMSVAVSRDGARAFVTGWSDTISAAPDYATVAYDTATGTQLWAKRFGSLGTFDVATSVGVSPDDSMVFVTGFSYTDATHYYDYATVAYDATTGARLWAARFDGSQGNDQAESLAVSPDGTKVFVTGGSAAGSVTDYATVAYDAARGTQLWVARYNGRQNGGGYAASLAVSPDGSKVFVTGGSPASPASDSDYATVAYDAATGAQLWVQRYRGPTKGPANATSLVVGPTGANVFVTGYTRGSTSGDDYATIAYDTATGTRLWVKRYDGPAGGTDDAQAVGVTPDGSRVIVTGSSTSATGESDFATIAYG